MTTTDYSPLASVSIDWKYVTGMRTTISYTKSIQDRIQFDDGLAGDGRQISRVKDLSNAIVVKTTYSFKAGKGLWLPLFGRIKIQSNLSLDLDVSRRTNQTENHDPGKASTITAKRVDFAVQPRISYNFSTNIKGGLNARWQDSDDLKNGKNHIRELEFWVEIRF
jgi:hypothetical protein